MVDDDRSGTGADLGGWLEVEPLDEVTRHRLVATAMHESVADDVGPAHGPSRAWRWMAVAAAIVVVLAGGLALLTARGGHDDEQATGHTPAAVTPKSVAVAPELFGQAAANAPDVGDFGDLGDTENLAALRTALAHPRAATGASRSADAATGAPLPSAPGCLRGVVGTIVAVGRGTIDGRPVTVVRVQGAGGKSSIDAFFDDSCEIRHLSH